MAIEFSKRQRAELRSLQGVAWQRELEAALRTLRDDFKAWGDNKLSAFDLSDRIHECHSDTARELYKTYATSMNEIVVVDALIRGIIEEKELSVELLDALRSDIEYFRQRRKA